MQSVTLFIAIFASVLVLFLRPQKAFAVYIITLVVYPTFLVLRIGPLDISAGRIVVAVLLLRCLADSRLVQGFKWNRLDSWITFSMIVAIVIPLFAWRVSAMRILESRAGSLMDSYFTYLVARFCITDRAAIIDAVKWISIALVPMAFIGIIESSTGWQPYSSLRIYCPWDPEIVTTQGRLGFYRAVGPFGHPIMFGAAFALFLPFVYSLRHEFGYWRVISYFLCSIIIIGALSSMSSGPLMMVIMIVGCFVLEHFKKWTRPLILLTVISCVIVDIISNRTFYHVIASYANPIGGTGWHRAKLIDLAIEHFDEWWLAGYGGRDPGWGSSLGMVWTDITNQYIGAAVTYGILGLIALCGVLVVALLSLIRLHRFAKDPVLKSWYWSMGSLIAVLMISFSSCTFFGQTSTLYYSILGIVGSSARFFVRDISLSRGRTRSLQFYARCVTGYDAY